MKEVHALCIQLQKLVETDLMIAQKEVGSAAKVDISQTDFNKDTFKKPSKAETSILQQVVISGLTENLCRVAPLFDA